jgi:hypothetical protein
MMTGSVMEAHFKESPHFHLSESTCFHPVDVFEFSMNNLGINGKFNCMPLNLILI